MTTGSFPSNPGKRKVIIVLHQCDIERCSYEPGSAKILIDEEAHILQFPMLIPEDAPSALENIDNAGLVHPGSILIQNPYDTDMYEDQSNALQRFALAKHLYFSTLCMHLGAREVIVEQVDIRNKSDRSQLGVEAGRAEGSAKLSIEKEELEQLRAQMHLHDEFAGGDADIAAAEHLLRRTGLWSDPNMRMLIDVRRDGANPLMQRTLKLNLSREAQSNLNVASRLAVPTFINIAFASNRVVRTEYDFTLTVHVRF